MSNKWQLKLEIASPSFQEMKTTADRLLRSVANARSPDDMPVGYTWGASTTIVELSSPVEEQIKWLRDRANEVEATLGKPA